jgi:hypothetical protein
MTPKEKAEELLKRYSNYAGGWKAEQCALIAVDEILDTLNYDIRDLDVIGNILLDLIKYWQEVKQEIEKI